MFYRFVFVFFIFCSCCVPGWCNKEKDEFDAFLDSRLSRSLRRQAIDHYLEEKKFKRASFVYDCILTHDQPTWEDYRNAGRTALELGKNQKAADLLEKAIKDASEPDWESHFLLGKAYLRLKNYPGAYWYANMALDLKPDAPYESHRVAAKAAYQIKRYDEALHILQKFEFPELEREAAHYAIMGISACNLQRYEEALEHCGKSMKANPLIDRRVYVRAGKAALELGKYEEALKYYQEVFKSYPHRKWRVTRPQVSVSWNCYASAAQAAFHLRKYKVAEKYFQIAERLKEGRELSPRLYCLWACTLAERVENNPWKDEELNLLHDRFERKKKAAAHKYFSKVLEFKDDDLNIEEWYKGATTLLQLKQYDLAIRYIQRACQLNPDSSLSVQLLQTFHNCRNHADNVDFSLEDLFSVRTFYDCAIKYYDSNETNNAVDLFKKILIKDASILSVAELYKAASILYNQTQYALALQYITLAYAVDHEAYGLELCVLAGQIHFAKADYAEAVLCFQQVYETNPTQDNRITVIECEIMKEVKELGQENALQNLSAFFQSSFERQQAYDKALAIIALKDKLRLKEDHPVIQFAAIVKTKAVSSEDPKNPYNIRSYLQERHQEYVDWLSIVPREEVVAGHTVRLVPAYFANQGPRILTFGQLPDYPLTFFEDEVFALEERVSADKNVSERIFETTGKTLTNLKFKLFQDGYIQGEFKRKGEAAERVPLTQLRLIAIVSHLLTLSTNREEDSIFSEREETFIRMLYGLAQCHVGQGENIEAMYLNVVPPKKRNLDVSQQDFVDQIVDQIALEFGKTLSGNPGLLRAVLELSSKRDIYQPPHQERYYRNLIGGDLALGGYIQFDLYSNTVLFDLFKLNRQHALQHFYNHMSPGKIVCAIAEWAGMEEFDAVERLVELGILNIKPGWSSNNSF